jgi:hypothetical protein
MFSTSSDTNLLPSSSERIPNAMAMFLPERTGNATGCTVRGPARAASAGC